MLSQSWLNRNSKPPRDGQSVTCMHCEQKFIYHKQRARTLRNYLQGYDFDDASIICLVVSRSVCISGSSSGGSRSSGGTSGGGSSGGSISSISSSSSR